MGIVLDVVQLEFFAWATKQLTVSCTLRQAEAQQSHSLKPTCLARLLLAQILESWPTEDEFEMKLIAKQFQFCWFKYVHVLAAATL